MDMSSHADGVGMRRATSSRCSCASAGMDRYHDAASAHKELHKGMDCVNETEKVRKCVV